jgi:hypothetical protein
MTADTQPLTVDLFLSVDGWARGTASPGYFGYFGPELDKWITTELARPQLIILGRRTYEALAGLPEEARDDSAHRMTELSLAGHQVLDGRVLLAEYQPTGRDIPRM